MIHLYLAAVVGGKFLLAELGTKAAALGHIEVLGDIGLSSEKLAKCREWAAAKKAVSLRFSAKETCAFDHTKAREVESATKCVAEYASLCFASTSVRYGQSGGRFGPCSRCHSCWAGTSSRPEAAARRPTRP